MCHARLTNLYTWRLGKERSWCYNGCLHVAHQHCLTKLNGERVPDENECPLCRTPYNVFLPHDEVGDPRQCFPENSYIGSAKIAKASNKELFVELLKSLPNVVGFQGVLNQNAYLTSKKSMANRLFLVMKNLWSKLHTA